LKKPSKIPVQNRKNSEWRVVQTGYVEGRALSGQLSVSTRFEGSRAPEKMSMRPTQQKLRGGDKSPTYNTALPSAESMEIGVGKQTSPRGKKVMRGTKQINDP